MQINILGFGNMGRAIARALISNKYKAKIVVTDHHPVKMTGVVFDASMKSLPEANVIIIGVKPQDIPALAEGVRGKIPSRAIILSIAAGVKIGKLQKLFHHRKIIRMMPNLGMLVGQGIAAWKAAGLTSADKKQARALLNGICENFTVADEKLIDAVTAISGSGPAYFFFLADALTSAGRNLGLSPAQSRMLVEKTFLAAAQLQRGEDYQELIKLVRSKKGTTDAALKVFQKKGMQKIIGEAVKAAHRRAGELSR